MWNQLDVDQYKSKECMVYECKITKLQNSNVLPFSAKWVELQVFYVKLNKADTYIQVIAWL